MGVFSHEGITRFNDLTEKYIEHKFVDPAKAKKGEDMRMKKEWLDWEKDYVQRVRDHLKIKDEVPKAKGRKRDQARGAFGGAVGSG